MPIHFAKDTRDYVGEFARGCESRTLLQQRFGFAEDLDAARRIALDLWIDGGIQDLEEQRTTVAREIKNLERRLDGADLDPEKRSKAEETLRVQRSLESLFARILKGAPQARTYPPDRSWLKLPDVAHRTFELKSRQRLAIGLANGVLDNAGLTLQRRYGHPLIPGSALKGLARRGAADLGAEAALVERLLGSQPQANRPQSGREGAVGFMDAVGIQTSVELDIVTPHYGNYYSESRKSPNPTARDEELPVPNVFPVVAAGSRFRFDLVILRPAAWLRSDPKAALDTAQNWLTHALAVFGIGGKTRSGYGRFGSARVETSGEALFPTAVPPSAPVKSPAEACLERWRGRFNSFTLPQLIADLAKLSDDDLRTVARQVIPMANWDTQGRPANPATNPNWQQVAKLPGGAQILAKLTQFPT